MMEKQTDRTKRESTALDRQEEELLSKRRWASVDGGEPLLLFDTRETALLFGRLSGLDLEDLPGPLGAIILEPVILESEGVELLHEAPPVDPNVWHPIPYRTKPRQNILDPIQESHLDDTCKMQSGSSDVDS